jgi:histidinol-phosphatase
MSYLNQLHHLADQADSIARRYFTGHVAVHVKSDASPVSEADLEIEKMIRREMQSFSDDFAIWGEEFGKASETKPLTLIVDPIDATRNFIRGLPWFATLMAIQSEGTLIAGLISSPITQDRWWAELGQGAFHNSTQMQVSSHKTFSGAQAFYGSLFGSEAQDVPRERVLSLLAQTSRQRGVGDYLAHTLVAMGCGEFSVDFGLKPWDMAPLKVIVEEAGGKVTHDDGSFDLEKTSLICSNGHLHHQVLEFLY